MSGVAKLEQAPDEPLLHTVEEAAELLRIGRTLAYSLARRYRTSGGREGLAVIRLGNCLRVPRWALLELARNGRVVPLSELVRDETDRPRRVAVRLAGRTAAGREDADEAGRPDASRAQTLGRSSRVRHARRRDSFEQLALLPPG